MKIALVHDYLNEAGGAERVLRVLADMYPDAPIYTAFAKNGSAKRMFQDRQIRESRWGWFLCIGRFYSYFRFLLPWVWKSMDLTGYDLVVTSCSGYIARGFRVGDSTTVVAYCHTPPRWLYGYETPTDGRSHWWGKMYLAIFGPFVRYFDYTSAQRVNVWVANSEEVARRIRKFYRHKATVIYPPIEIKESKNQRNKETNGDYYLTVARVVGAKGLELAAHAARHMKRKLIVVGELIGGSNLEARIRQAGGEWVELAGRVDDATLSSLYTHARGYLALAQDEDFGMTVVESMLYGTPVVALKSGGYKETVVDLTNQHTKVSKNQRSSTGILIERADVDSVVKGMRALEETKWDRETIEKWAKTFNRDRFEKAMREVVRA